MRSWPARSGRISTAAKSSLVSSAATAGPASIRSPARASRPAEGRGAPDDHADRRRARRRRRTARRPAPSRSTVSSTSGSHRSRRTAGSPRPRRTRTSAGRASNHEPSAMRTLRPGAPEPGQVGPGDIEGVGAGVGEPHGRPVERQFGGERQPDRADPVPRSATDRGGPDGPGLARSPHRPRVRSRVAGSAPAGRSAKSRWRNAHWPSTYWSGSPGEAGDHRVEVGDHSLGRDVAEHRGELARSPPTPRPRTAIGRAARRISAAISRSITTVWRMRRSQFQMPMMVSTLRPCRKMMSIG